MVWCGGEKGGGVARRRRPCCHLSAAGVCVCLCHCFAALGFPPFGGVRSIGSAPARSAAAGPKDCPAAARLPCVLPPLFLLDLLGRAQSPRARCEKRAAARECAGYVLAFLPPLLRSPFRQFSCLPPTHTHTCVSAAVSSGGIYMRCVCFLSVKTCRGEKEGERERGRRIQNPQTGWAQEQPCGDGRDQTKLPGFVLRGGEERTRETRENQTAARGRGRRGLRGAKKGG